jgi:Nickel responsive protein SCO4226-like
VGADAPNGRGLGPDLVLPVPARRARWLGAVHSLTATGARQLIVSQSGETLMALRKFIIERDIPKVGTFEREQLRGAAAKSNQVLTALAPDIQWVESYVADNKTFCVYLAKDEAVIRKHAEMSGFPATEITEVKRMIDPTTETG